MFNLTGSEIIVILLLALVVLGPEKLPDAIRRVGKTYAELRKMGTGFQQEFKAAMEEPMREMRESAEALRRSADFSDDSSDDTSSGRSATGRSGTNAPGTNGSVTDRPATGGPATDGPAAAGPPPNGTSTTEAPAADPAIPQQAAPSPIHGPSGDPDPR